MHVRVSKEGRRSPALILLFSSPDGLLTTTKQLGESLALAIDSISDINNPGKMMPRPWHGSGVHVPDAGCVLFHCDRWGTEPWSVKIADVGSTSKCQRHPRTPSHHVDDRASCDAAPDSAQYRPPAVGAVLPDWAGRARLRGQALVDFDGLVSWCNVECDLPRHL